MRHTFKAICWLAVAACLVGTTSALAAGDEGASSVFQYLAKRAGKLAAQRPPVADSQAGAEKQRGEVLRGVAETLGLPPREPMKAAVTHQKEDGDLAIEEVIYHWAGPTYAAGHVIRLKGTDGRRPGLIVCPGHLAHYTWHGYREFVDRMARAGLVVLFVEDPRIGRRHTADAGLHAVAAAAGTPVMGIQVFDALRGLDYLLTRPDIDPGRVSIAGFSSGAQQAWLAAALESRFHAIVTVGGEVMSERLPLLALLKSGSIADPSIVPANPLCHAGRREIAACVSPRPTLAVSDAGKQVELWLVQQLKSLPASNAAPLPCGKPDKPDLKVMMYLRGRIAKQAAASAKSLESPAQWQPYRQEIARWLDEACGLKNMQPGAAKVIAASTDEGLAVETVRLAVDAGLSCPAVLVHRAAPGTGKQAAVVFSHDGRLSAEAPEVQATVRQLATQGYWVLVPDHVSIHPKSRRKLELAEVPGFFAAADLAGLPPLALRVAENLAAFRYLAGRSEVDPARIVAGGSGIGAIDACLSAVLEARIAGVAAVNVTTLRDWADNVAPEETLFLHTLPYLPGILAKTDLDYCFAAIAPRPLVIARLKEGWPKSGFEQVAATAAAAYRLAGAEKALVAVGLRDPIDERIARLPEGLQKQTTAVARAILPAPAVPGVVGTREGLRSRDVIDSATGIVWLFSTVGGEEQEFCDGGYRLDTWSFFNDNGPAQRGSAVTPLLFKKEGDAYKLTGIGKSRVNAGTGLQTFPFDVVQGSDQVGAGHFFGFYTGDPAGKPSAGVVEYNDDYQDRMIILTFDGAMVDQKVALGQNFRENSRWPRAYSIQAVSKRK